VNHQAGVAGEQPIPASAGIGLRAPHHARFLDTEPGGGWVEIHSENFFADGGPQLAFLEKVRARYPLSCHGVGLSLGSTDPIDRGHLRRLKRLVDRFEPAFVSEHCCFASVGGRFVNDLLPLPYTEEALAHMVQRVDEVQEYLGRQLLIENPSSYLEFNCSVMWEWEFLTELSRATGCALLLDVNNIYVSARNNGFDAADYLRGIPGGRVREIHLAGYSINRKGDREILIDTHGARVYPAVWELYDHAVRLFGPVPTLIEWDTDLPDLDVLVDEAERANAIMEARHALVA
jgi:uncharacterized protein (UPF0276 family)